MEQQVIACRYIKLDKLRTLLKSLFGTNFAVDVSIRLVKKSMLEGLAKLYTLRSGKTIIILPSRGS